MADSRSNYSLTTFNSSGELVQIKHALAAVQAGATSLGIRATNGVVLATEKKNKSILFEDHSTFKVKFSFFSTADSFILQK